MLSGKHTPTVDLQSAGTSQPSLADKIEFLTRGDSYRPPVAEVSCHETHMSLVFLAGDRVYKLKKPVRFPYLDFSTLARREAACRSELKLNRRLAPDVYREVVPLVRSAQGLAIGGEGETVDWLVAMNRLDETQMLDRVIGDGRLHPWQLDRVAAVLVQFYRKASVVLISPSAYAAELWRSLAFNRRILLDPRFRLPSGRVLHVDAMQRRFLMERGELLAERVRKRHIVDGHGDLRPEHICLGDPVRIIDCLEFNARLRMVDPFDEIAFLCVECERLGAAWAGEYLRRRIMHSLHDGDSEELFIFYRCHRATLRARLAVAHLLEPNPRAPAKWEPLARTYLQLAAVDAIKLERILKRPEGRSMFYRHAGAERPLPGGAQSQLYRSWPARPRHQAGRAESSR
jgi:aminoglycoside phosphotransferase family enzyme